MDIELVRKQWSEIVATFENFPDMVGYLDGYLELLQRKLHYGIKDEQFQNQYFSYYHFYPHISIDSQEFFDIALKHLESWDLDFESVLDEISSFTGKVDICYATHLLHTLCDHMPIWNGDVEIAIKILSPGVLDEADRLYATDYKASALEKWKVLNEFYATLHSSGEALRFIEAFDGSFPSYSHVPQCKKIDFILWSFGRSMDTDPSVESEER